jgi:hypothetical protein
MRRGLDRSGCLERGMAMAHERPEARSIRQSTVFAEHDRTALNASEVDELLNENKRLREIVIFLSEIIVRNVVGRT